MSEFARRLKELRKQNSVKQETLAKYLNFGASAISSYETAQHEPTYDILMKICDYFSVSVDYMLGHSDSMFLADEKQVVEYYRKLRESDKLLINALLKSMTED